MLLVSRGILRAARSLPSRSSAVARQQHAALRTAGMMGGGIVRKRFLASGGAAAARAGMLEEDWPQFAGGGCGGTLSAEAAARTALERVQRHAGDYEGAVGKGQGEGRPFDKVLIANRGEIACRVIETCNAMGIETVALYSDADVSGKHVRMATEAYRVGPAPSSQSYLQIPRIVEVIRESGAQAVHPGYGFLSENNQFSAAVEEAGAVFIGPNAHAIEAMGDKITSKRIATEAGVSVIPGFQGLIADADEAVKIANEIGYPVMIKASAGGGGKGMRVAFSDAELREGFRLSRDEAKSSFGDDRMFVEKFIENPHHIEIQVLADTHGNVVTFAERECSVQRRNQKVVEESPSCLLTPETRRAMQEEAIQLAKAVGYRSAGTVEMLCDDNQNFYFLEMNTRLQVEHPVTEYVSGEDLVKHMLWVGAGAPLPKRLTDQTFIPPTGHSVECRVYAEDPLRGFLPSTGPLVQYQEPGTFFDETTGENTVRVDSGIYAGGEISMFYDPMISKLVTFGKDRAAAIGYMKQALDDYIIEGVGHNICFLRDVMRNRQFVTGDYSTMFIPEQYPDGFHGVTMSEQEKKRLASTAALMHQRHWAYGNVLPSNTDLDEQLQDFDDMGSIFADFNHEMDWYVTVGGHDGETFRVCLSYDETEDCLVSAVTTAEVDSDSGEISIDEAGEENLAVTDFEWESGHILCRTLFDEKHEETMQYLGRLGESSYRIKYLGTDHQVTIRDAREQELSVHILPPVVQDFSKMLICPMPGTVISLNVEAGQHVEVGQELCVIEAMKMQNILRAERAGQVKEIHAAAGDRLAVDAVIMTFEED